MKVIYIYKDFDVFNGLIRTFIILAKRRNELHFDFKVCVFRDPRSTFAEQFRALGGTLDSLGVVWEDTPLIIWKLYRYLKKERPDVVHTFILKPNLYGRIAALLAGVPVIISNELTLIPAALNVPFVLASKLSYASPLPVTVSGCVLPVTLVTPLQVVPTPVV